MKNDNMILIGGLVLGAILLTRKSGPVSDQESGGSGGFAGILPLPLGGDGASLPPTILNILPGGGEGGGFAIPEGWPGLGDINITMPDWWKPPDPQEVVTEAAKTVVTDQVEKAKDKVTETVQVIVNTVTPGGGGGGGNEDTDRYIGSTSTKPGWGVDLWSQWVNATTRWQEPPPGELTQRTRNILNTPDTGFFPWQTPRGEGFRLPWTNRARAESSEAEIERWDRAPVPERAAAREVTQGATPEGPSAAEIELENILATR